MSWGVALVWLSPPPPPPPPLGTHAQCQRALALACHTRKGKGRLERERRGMQVQWSSTGAGARPVACLLFAAILLLFALALASPAVKLFQLRARLTGALLQVAPACVGSWAG